MAFIDTDLNDIKQIFDSYLKFSDQFSSLYKVTKDSYDEVSEQLWNDAKGTIDDEEKYDEFVMLMRCLQDMYDDIMLKYNNILDRDFRILLTRLYDILEEYNRVHLS